MVSWYTDHGLSLADKAEGVLKQSDQEAYLWGRKAANKGLAKAEYAVGCEFTLIYRAGLR